MRMDRMPEGGGRKEGTRERARERNIPSHIHTSPEQTQGGKRMKEGHNGRVPPQKKMKHSHNKTEPTKGEKELQEE